MFITRGEWVKIINSTKFSCREGGFGTITKDEWEQEVSKYANAFNLKDPDTEIIVLQESDGDKVCIFRRNYFKKNT